MTSKRELERRIEELERKVELLMEAHSPNAEWVQPAYDWAPTSGFYNPNVNGGAGDGQLWRCDSVSVPTIQASTAGKCD